jgi:hypothetical protein
LAATRSPRGPTITDDQLEQVVEEYVKTKRAGRRNTNEAIALRFDVSRGTAARAVERARAAGFHLPTRRDKL